MIKDRDGWRDLADCIVWFALFHTVTEPIFAIFSGDLWGPHAFIAGAIIVASVLFGDSYFRDDQDALL